MCAGNMDLRFCHSKLKIMENTNQRIKQKALCWFRKSGVYEASCNKGVNSTVQAGKWPLDNSRSYDVSIIAYWKNQTDTLRLKYIKQDP